MSSKFVTENNSAWITCDHGQLAVVSGHGPDHVSARPVAEFAGKPNKLPYAMSFDGDGRLMLQVPVGEGVCVVPMHKVRKLLEAAQEIGLE